MNKHHRHMLGLALGGAAIAAVPVLAQRAPTSGPVARYDMRAGTVSGFGAMGGGASAAMGMMFGGGGGNRVQKELYLRLGSARLPDKGAPKADHFMPAVARLGKSVALTTPRLEADPELMPQKPKGRLLVFWGCGEHAPKGQPVVIDFAKIAAGQAPPGLWSSTVLRDIGPTITNSKTFGRWPAEDGKFVKPDSSLPGDHRVAANYSPEIAFRLSKDFMAPLRMNHARQPSGSTLLTWGPVVDATGYFASLFGGRMGPNGEMGDMVMWSSSATRQFGGGLSDWLSPGQVAALVRDRTVLAPTTSSCIVPVEVRKAGPDFSTGILTAYGPQEDFAHPPRPADPKAAWNLEWTARIRHRSTTSWMDMPGMEGPGMEGMSGMSGMGDDAAPAPTPQGQQQNCKPRGGLGGLGGLGGILGGMGKPGC